jgi:uncharacterized repeat protein (TIGR01451 family)
MDEIADTVDLPVGSGLLYEATGTVGYDVVPGPLVNTAAVNPPFGYIDLDGANNIATDVDDILWLADLWATNTDFSCWSNPGDPIQYHIEVGNSGPRDVFGAPVDDLLPAELLNGSWTCVGANGGICDYAGMGDFAQAVDLPVGSWVIITIDATVDPAATGFVRNGVYAAAPMPWEDRVPSNDFFLDTNMLEPPVFCDGFETGDTMMWAPVVP